MRTPPLRLEEEGFILSRFAPGPVQKRLALGVAVALLLAFVITAGPLSNLQLARIDPFVAIYAAAMFVNESITAILLFAQFSICRSRCLLVISSGYLYTALILIPWMLTFPGVFAPSGLLGAGLQSTACLYILWHAGFAAFVIGYALLKEMEGTRPLPQGPASRAILASIAMTAALISALTYLVTRFNDRMPVLMSDAVHLTGLWPYAAGAASSLCCLAIFVLWRRRRSVLDLWLMVVMCASVVEMLLISFPVPARYSLGWYSGRVCGFLSGSLVLIVLLYEITTLYGRLLAAVVARRREREARLVTGDAVSASIAHEVRQPLSGMITNADAGLRWLDRATPDIEEAKAALRRIVVDGHRAGALIGSVRAIFKKGVETRTALDINELVWEALSLARSDLQRHRISIEAVRKEQLPPVSGDPVQLRQVLLNLITNAIDAMAQQNGPRVLRVRSTLREPDGVMVSVEDTGPGIEPAHLERIFSPHFTTKSNGMGLGLSICRSIVEAHGRRLWAAANRSRGAAVRFVLPAKA